MYAACYCLAVMRACMMRSCIGGILTHAKPISVLCCMHAKSAACGCVVRCSAKKRT